MTTTELLNTLIDRSGVDGLPELSEVLAASVTVRRVYLREKLASAQLTLYAPQLSALRAAGTATQI